MDILREFFDPIPLAAMIAVVFALITVLVLALIFRMPSDFAAKEEFRAAIRSRLASDRLAEKLIEEAKDAKHAAVQTEKLAATESADAAASEKPPAAPAASATT